MAHLDKLAPQERKFQTLSQQREHFPTEIFRVE